MWRARAVEPGQRGELLIKGDQVFSGYLANEAETKASFTADGFFRTGTCDRRRTHGEFSIVDRMKELIKYQGFQVAPAELEGLLVTQPSVAAAAVVGRYDKGGCHRTPLCIRRALPPASAAKMPNKSWRRSTLS